MLASLDHSGAPSGLASRSVSGALFKSTKDGSRARDLAVRRYIGLARPRIRRCHPPKSCVSGTFNTFDCGLINARAVLSIRISFARSFVVFAAAESSPPQTDESRTPSSRAWMSPGKKPGDAAPVGMQRNQREHAVRRVARSCGISPRRCAINRRDLRLEKRCDSRI